ncbi:MAG: hypothetical protein EP297_11685 [Gammaproteobacteria bacterium]|nr:MAG: hypothetical protein EP297_11685 [Gammaproteobacteria bacterium]
MHHILTKTLLLLAIVLAIVSIATPDWTLIDLGKNAKGTSGLFRKCGGVEADGTKLSSCQTIHDKVPDLKACQGLAISSVVFLAIALACVFVPMDESKPCRLVGVGSFLIGLVLMIACVSLYADKVHHSDVLGGKYGYSFYLMVAAIVLAAGAGGSAMVANKEMS